MNSISTIMLAVDKPGHSFKEYSYTYLSRAYQDLENIGSILHLNYPTEESVIDFIENYEVVGYKKTHFETVPTRRKRLVPDIWRQFSTSHLADVLILYTGGSWFFRYRGEAAYKPFIYLTQDGIIDYITTGDYDIIKIQKYSDIQPTDLIYSPGPNNVLKIIKVSVDYDTGAFGESLQNVTVTGEEYIVNGQIPGFTIAPIGEFGGRRAIRLIGEVSEKAKFIVFRKGL